LDLSEFGDIATIAPLAGLQQLEELHMHGSTKVLDGDLTAIAQLPRLRLLSMKSRQYYAPSVRELQETITGRTR
jgi:internalin A